MNYFYIFAIIKPKELSVFGWLFFLNRHDNEFRNA